MSTMIFDAAGIARMREVSPSKQVSFQQTPRRNPVREVALAPAKIRRARTSFGSGSALAYECDGWMRWTGA